MIDKLPLTNKNYWDNKKLFWFQVEENNYECFTRLVGGKSIHGYFFNGQIEGIKIKWKKNTFEGLKNKHTYHLLHNG